MVSDGLSAMDLTSFLMTTDLWSDGLLLKNYKNLDEFRKIILF